MAGKKKESCGFGAFYSRRRLGFLGTDNDVPRHPYHGTRGGHRTVRTPRGGVDARA